MIRNNDPDLPTPERLTNATNAPAETVRLTPASAVSPVSANVTPTSRRARKSGVFIGREE